MTCRRCRDAVSALLDDEQLPEDDFVIRNHLPRCAACRAAAERAREITLMARSWRADPPPDTPPDFLAALLAASAVPEERFGPTPNGAPCAVDHPHLHPVGNAACGCAPGCRCGCQEGKRCQCGHTAA
jgi:hypothetical protein